MGFGDHTFSGSDFHLDKYIGFMYSIKTICLHVPCFLSNVHFKIFPLFCHQASITKGITFISLLMMWRF